VTHGAEVVHLVRVDSLHRTDQRRRVGEVAVDQAYVGVVRRHDLAAGVALSPNETGYFVTLLVQQLGKVATVLTGDSGDKRDASFVCQGVSHSFFGGRSMCPSIEVTTGAVRLSILAVTRVAE
jgi:hypothetical protein